MKELNELKKLFKGVTFTFLVKCDSIVDFKTQLPIDIAGQYCHFQLSFFDHDSAIYHGINSFDDLTYYMKLFEVMQLPEARRDDIKILYHQKYVDPSAN